MIAAPTIGIILPIKVRINNNKGLGAPNIK